eukprot:1533573-Rhodomonas_salina.2
MTSAQNDLSHAKSGQLKPGARPVRRKVDVKLLPLNTWSSGLLPIIRSYAPAIVVSAPAIVAGTTAIVVSAFPP